MKIKKTNKSVVANAIVWAAMIIASSLLMTGNDKGDMMMLLLVAGWTATHNLVNNASNSRRSC